MVDAEGTVGATYTPDCAALHPLRLARGLADSLVRRGVTIHEHSRVTGLLPGRAVTTHGTVSAGSVIRATEGYTSRIAGHRRVLAPIYSLVIATEPLAPDVWERIGLRRRETFSDHRHLIIYGQRTADDRLVFGGRGAPYHFGSRISEGFDADVHVFGKLRATLVELFPVLADTRVTHAWGGPLGRPARLVRVGRARPRHPARLGRRVRRRRGQHHEPRRPHPARPGARPRHRRSPGCRGSATGPRRGSRSRCAGSGSTPDCAR